MDASPVYLIIAALTLPSWVALADLLIYLSRGRFYVDNIMLGLCVAAAFIVYPALYITLNTENNCCDASAAFAKDHVVSVVAIINLLCRSVYVLCAAKKDIFSGSRSFCQCIFNSGYCP